MMRMVAMRAGPSYTSYVSDGQDDRKRRLSVGAEQLHTPAVIHRDVAYERETQARAFLARRIERLEQAAARLRRDFLAAVPYREPDGVVLGPGRDFDDAFAAMLGRGGCLHGVAREIEQRAPQL